MTSFVFFLLLVLAIAIAKQGLFSPLGVISIGIFFLYLIVVLYFKDLKRKIITEDEIKKMQFALDDKGYNRGLKRLKKSLEKDLYKQARQGKEPKKSWEKELKIVNDAIEKNDKKILY